MWILQNVEFLGELFFAYRERHRIRPGRLQQRDTPRIGRLTPAFRPGFDVRGIERAGPQPKFRARLGTQVPPYAIHTGFHFARLAVFASFATTNTATRLTPPSRLSP